MDVVIAGGHDKVALRLTRRAHERDDAMRSLIRDPSHAADVEAAGGQPIVCDLEQVSEDELARAIAGSDVAAFAAGACPGRGPERSEESCAMTSTKTRSKNSSLKLARHSSSPGRRRTSHLVRSLTSIAMEWTELPDGSRARWDNGIRIVDRTQRHRSPAIEHLVTWPEQGGNVVVMGLDVSCRPVYITALQAPI